MRRARRRHPRTTPSADWIKGSKDERREILERTKPKTLDVALCSPYLCSPNCSPALGGFFGCWLGFCIITGVVAVFLSKWDSQPWSVVERTARWPDEQAAEPPPLTSTAGINYILSHRYITDAPDTFFHQRRPDCASRASQGGPLAPKSSNAASTPQLFGLCPGGTTCIGFPPIALEIPFFGNRPGVNRSATLAQPLALNVASPGGPPIRPGYWQNDRKKKKK